MKYIHPHVSQSLANTVAAVREEAYTEELVGVLGTAEAQQAVTYGRLAELIDEVAA